jgi:hypothetical protein
VQASSDPVSAILQHAAATDHPIVHTLHLRVQKIQQLNAVAAYTPADLAYALSRTTEAGLNAIAVELIRGPPSFHELARFSIKPAISRKTQPATFRATLENVPVVHRDLPWSVVALYIAGESFLSNITAAPPYSTLFGTMGYRVDGEYIGPLVTGTPAVPVPVHIPELAARALLTATSTLLMQENMQPQTVLPTHLRDVKSLYGVPGYLPRADGTTVPVPNMGLALMVSALRAYVFIPDGGGPDGGGPDGGGPDGGGPDGGGPDGGGAAASVFEKLAMCLHTSSTSLGQAAAIAAKALNAPDEPLRKWIGTLKIQDQPVYALVN